MVNANYELGDSNFIKKMVLPAYNQKTYTGYNTLVPIVKIYHDEKLPIVPNIAAYYFYRMNHGDMDLNKSLSKCDSESTWLEKIYPEIRYKHLYLNQIKEKLQMLSILK